MAVVRQLSHVSARIYEALTLPEMMQAVADGIVDGLGFGVAVVNQRKADGTYAVTAVAGPPEVHDHMADATVTAEEMDRILSEADMWGRLRFVPTSRKRHFTVATEWVPDIDRSDDGDDRWDPDDMLVIPLGAADRPPVAVISVDLPPGGLRPSLQLQELLELFALQAGGALTATLARDAQAGLLRHRATHDDLTGLPNRRILQDRFDEAAAAASHGLLTAAFVLDLNDFKQLNDEFGHQVGDRALQAAVDAMRHLLRPTDLVARVGGDEFAILAEVSSREAAAALHRRLDQLAVAVPGTDATVVISAGLALVEVDGDYIGTMPEARFSVVPGAINVVA